MLNGAEVLARGEGNVVNRHIVLEVDEGLARFGREPTGADRASGQLGRRNGLGRIAGKAAKTGRLGSGGMALLEGSAQGERTCGCPGRKLGLHALIRHECGDVLPPAELPARLAEEVNRRVPPARDGKMIAVNPALAFANPHVHCLERLSAARGNNRASSETRGPNRKEGASKRRRFTIA
jgi:hypothetical protein